MRDGCVRVVIRKGGGRGEVSQSEQWRRKKIACYAGVNVYTLYVYGVERDELSLTLLLSRGPGRYGL